ncbi:drug/metabolite transporter (DMT)-like permease [Paenibacillus shirakamiensis]|uniref:Drug/metabolite transporter (DMT)-like permease n=1 Tax=Paenibacillus shirakamiensis TaxID=1265935 RepID=A0ABS4JI21_9BACL|nr:DMT family transporter [Paenibacillus shirakamiensis]MBP2000761.1 drug/metabolite transporter (DMT)-like permease [Paenibacillus shirakamiensis]
MKNTNIIGVFLALGAALLNGTVGILSKDLISSELTSSAVSFYKCLIAFLALSLYSLFSASFRRAIVHLTSKIMSIALCSFLGIFVLYFFETTAYTFEVVPYVVFILLGASTVTTFLCSSIWLKEKKHIVKYVGLLLLIVGLVIMALAEGAIGSLSKGAVLAGIAGLGYGLFLVFTKRFKLEGGLPLIWYFMLFGVIYLFIPFSREGWIFPEISTYPSLVALAVFPTIGGFYCTTMALTMLEANKVQMLELSEPIFATVFSFIILQETVHGMEWLGAIIILIAIVISEYSPKEKKLSNTISVHQDLL